MFQHVVFLLSVSLTLALGDDRVIGGWIGVEGQFGHQVSLRENFKHFCGGTILDQWTIITAAHCLDGRTLSNVIVVAGTPYLSVGGQVYDISEQIIHPEYNPSTLENDLAILKLPVPLVFHKYARAAALPKSPPDVDTFLAVTGWGWSKYPGEISEEMRYLRMKTIDIETCAKALEGKVKVDERNICIRPNVGEGSCYGDYGNGIFDYSDYYHGTAVWSSTPCGEGNPDVFMNASAYLDWIQENMSNE